MTAKNSFLEGKASAFALSEVYYVHVLVRFIHISEVEMHTWLLAGGGKFVHCWEVILSSECPLSEVPLYTMVIF